MEYYNLDQLINLIKEKDFKVISIQCSDTNESIKLCDYLQDVFSKESERNFYILGDVLTGSCCLDIIATKRLNADCIVYIGESCFFDLESKYYIFYLYPKLNVNLSLIKEKVNSLCNTLEFNTVLYVYKCTLHYILEDIVDVFLKNQKNVLVASCPDSESNNNNNNNNLFKFCNRNVYKYYLEDGKTIKKDNKNNINSNDNNTNSTDNNNNNNINNSSNNTSKKGVENIDLVFYINDNDDETLAKSISLENKCNKFYELKILDESYTLIDKSKWLQDVLMKRYLAIEKAKDTEIFGIITLTKSFKYGNNLRKLLQKLLIMKKRKCQLFCINHLTEAKLQNFHKIEIWILLSCNLTHLSLERELGRLVIFPYEVLISLDVLDWSKDSYIFEFKKLSDIIEKYIKIKFHENIEINNEEEYIDNKNNNKELLEDQKNKELRTLTKMELSRRFEDLYETISSNEKREFKGVDPDYNFDKIPMILKGSYGTPASYKHELEYK